MLSCVLTLLLSQTFLSELGLHQSVLRAVALLAITFTRCQLQTEWGSSHVILFVSRDCTLFSNTERPPKAKHVGSKHKPLFLSATPFTPEKQQKLSKKVNKHPYRAFLKVLRDVSSRRGPIQKKPTRVAIGGSSESNKSLPPTALFFFFFVFPSREYL